MRQEMSSMTMTSNQSAIYLVESFLDENFLFRRNLLNGKTEFLRTTENTAEDSPEEETTGKEEEKHDWQVLTAEAFNSIVRQAKKLGIGGQKSPRQDIDEYIKSNDVPLFDPVRAIPGATTQVGWQEPCRRPLRQNTRTDERTTWLVRHMAPLGRRPLAPDGHAAWQRSRARTDRKPRMRKSTFAVRLLPEELRQYFLDHINFGNKFDTEMALTHNLLVNIDEFANMGASQQAKLKQLLSKVKVNGRPIYGKSQDDRTRYASFLATTNDTHPLCDPTGSRRYICLQVPDGEYIDNGSPIDYGQLYSQVIYELREEETPYWFTNDEVARIQERNQPFFKAEDLDIMLKSCFRMPACEEEGKWMVSSEVFDALHAQYPMLKGSMSTKVKIGQALKILGCKSKHTKHGQAYLLTAA